MRKRMLLLTAVGVLLAPRLMYAGTTNVTKTAETKNLYLIIENENTKDLSLLIKPEKNVSAKRSKPDDNHKGWFAFTVPGASKEGNVARSEFVIPAKDLSNFDYYSITGETNALTPIGTCYNLKAGKYYKLRFSNNDAGTDCVSTEIQGDIPHVEGVVKIIPTRKMVADANQTRLTPKRPSQVLDDNDK